MFVRAHSCGRRAVAVSLKPRPVGVTYPFLKATARGPTQTRFFASSSSPPPAASDEQPIERKEPKYSRKPSIPTDQLIEHYPLELSGRARRSTFEPTPDWWPWAERVFLGAARRNVARMTTWGWMDSRFGDLGGANDAERYFPTTFGRGARGAFSAIISRLSEWDGQEENDQGLSEMMDETLYARFRDQHAWLADEGIVVEFEEDEDPLDATPEVSDVWLTFGRKSDAKGTLMPGKVVRRFNPLGFLKDIGTDSYIFREVTFEYVIPKSSIPNPSGSSSLSLGTRGDVIKKGQVVGVDLSFPVRLRIVFRDINTRSILWKRDEVGTVALRFECDHFVDKPDGNWKLVDVDRLRQDELVREEEKCLGVVPDE
ncbi:hypothetical protein HDU87_001762 [Geranomyces variabilis]|uniref:Uncharacterized protein n=1 Tax=Geranomyces variabilis TaxID=109894 RepID=A0AAD5XP50_9FUNG|nr:hypothetical protein HDU87_001762 [Geranomyces variabilis]